MVTAVVSIEIGWNVFFSAYFNTSHCEYSHWQSRVSVKQPGYLIFSSRMSLLQGVLSLLLSWMGLFQVLYVVAAGFGAVVAVWTAKLLARHAWYTHRLSCFSKPHANSWLLGHLGQVG